MSIKKYSFVTQLIDKVNQNSHFYFSKRNDIMDSVVLSENVLLKIENLLVDWKDLVNKTLFPHEDKVISAVKYEIEHNLEKYKTTNNNIYFYDFPVKIYGDDIINKKVIENELEKYIRDKFEKTLIKPIQFIWNNKNLNLKFEVRYPIVTDNL